MKMHMKNRRDIYLEDHFIVCDHQVNKNTKTLPNRQIQNQMAVFSQLTKESFWYGLWMFESEIHTQRVWARKGRRSEANWKERFACL